MITARPAFQLELRASDHYLVLLGGALLGYAVLGKYFAYLGIPPLFVGEIALLAGFAVALRTAAWWQRWRRTQSPAGHRHDLGDAAHASLSGRALGERAPDRQ